ncbi:MAG: acetyl-CoA hydrolase [Burkholderiaceae bacterium]|nr:acetyl-CoA hydrolase [Burkholderiaceae bacterium]
MTIELREGDLDLTDIVRTGDTVFWGQGTSEPLTLTESLVRQRADIGPIKVFLGAAFSTTVQPEHTDYLSCTSYGSIGENRHLSKAGVLQILPCHYSQLPHLIARGELRCDVAFLQLSAQNPAGDYSLGVANDYMLDAARAARVVVAEINDRLPWTYDGGSLAGLRIDYVIRTSRPVVELKAPPPGEREQRISMHAARYVPDGAVLETGIGAVPDAILSALHDHRDLGVHTGSIGDGIISLMEAGAVTNRLKPVDRDVTVSGVLFGSERLFRFAHRNPAIRLSPARYTHDPSVLARFDRFVAINSAIEVDLTGQVNAEVGDGTYMGAVGGQVDFVRAATSSRHGRSIIALPSTAKSDRASRIVARLAGGVTTSLRSDADIIVTEWGAAELRGQTIPERARRMIAIAHPAFRERLEREAHALFARNAFP